MTMSRVKSSARIVLLALALLLSTRAWAQQDHDPSRWLTLWAGMLPIIVAAPHGGRMALPGVAARGGVGVAQFTTERDSNTAELAELLAVKLGARLGGPPFLVIARFERKFIDANRAESSAFESAAARPYYEAYHRALQEASVRVRERWGSGLLLDLHGQGAEADTIFRGTNNGESVMAMRRRFGPAALMGPKSILAQMAVKGYRIAPTDDHERLYSGGYTTQTYGSHRGTEIDAIQLEFGSILRSRANLERTANDLAQAIEVFAKEYLPLAKVAGEDRPKLQP
jgi:N-formylglutamate amidohydrolase